MEHIVKDEYLDNNNIKVSIEKMSNTETRCRIKLDNNSLCNITQSGEELSWQNAHFHKYCNELYLVQRGKILFLTKEGEEINKEIINEGEIVIVNPYVSHNVYMFENSATCVLKYGSVILDD